MPPKKSKIPTDRVEPSVVAAAAAATAETATRSGAAAAATAEPSTPNPQPDGAATTQTHQETPEGVAEEIQLNQDGNEIEEDEDGEITDQARELRRLEQY